MSGEFILYRPNLSNEWYQQFQLPIDYSLGITDGPDGTICIIRLPKDFKPPRMNELGMKQTTMEHILEQAIQPVALCSQEALLRLVRTRALAIGNNSSTRKITEKIIRYAANIMEESIKAHES